MTKQRWEQVRELEELPMEIFWEYYQERGGKLKDFSTFRNVFEKAITQGMRIVTPDKVRVVTLNSALGNVYSYYNNKFKG